MQNNKPRTYTDEDILSADKVTVEAAARYLGDPIWRVRQLIEDKTVPYGECIIGTSGKRAFHINPRALVNYKHGVVPTPEGLIKEIAGEIAELNKNVAALNEKVEALIKIQADLRRK